MSTPLSDVVVVYVVANVAEVRRKDALEWTATRHARTDVYRRHRSLGQGYVKLETYLSMSYEYESRRVIDRFTSNRAVHQSVIAACTVSESRTFNAHVAELRQHLNVPLTGLNKVSSYWTLHYWPAVTCCPWRVTLHM